MLDAAIDATFHTKQLNFKKTWMIIILAKKLFNNKLIALKMILLD